MSATSAVAGADIKGTDGAILATVTEVVTTGDRQPAYWVYIIPSEEVPFWSPIIDAVTAFLNADPEFGAGGKLTFDHRNNRILVFRRNLPCQSLS